MIKMYLSLRHLCIELSGNVLDGGKLGFSWNRSMICWGEKDKGASRVDVCVCVCVRARAREYGWGLMGVTV